MTRSERTYYLLFALYAASWSFLTPVYPVFLLRRGLDLFQINVVFAVYLIGAFVFEVPTGAIADIIGRKTSFLLSCSIRAVAFAMYWSAQGFGDCLKAELVDSIGTTLASGALDAWAVDGMREEGDDRPADRIFARAYFLASPFMMATGMIGAYVADVDIALPWPCGAASFAFAGLVAVVLMRENRKRAPRMEGPFRVWARTTRDGFATVYRIPTLVLLCGLTAATSFAVMPAWHYWPARLQDLSHQGMWLLGWVWVLVTLAGMGGNALMPWLVLRFRRERVLAAAALLRGGVLLAAAASANFFPSLFAVVTMQGVRGFAEPTLQGWMNEHVESGLRATVLSVRAMSFTLGGGVGLLCLGLVARSGGIAAAWGGSALLILVSAPAFLLLGCGRLRAAQPKPAIGLSPD